MKLTISYLLFTIKKEEIKLRENSGDNCLRNLMQWQKSKNV